MVPCHSSLITTVIVSQSVAVSFKVALSSALKATIALLIIVVVATVVVVLLRVVVVVVVGWQAGFYSPWSHGQPLLQLLHLEEESSEDGWSGHSPVDKWNDYENTTYIQTDVSYTHDKVCQIIINHNETQEIQGRFGEHELIEDSDNDIRNILDYLIRKDPPYYANEDEEKFKEQRCKLLGIPYAKPPTCKSEKFEVSIQRIQFIDTTYRSTWTLSFIFLAL
ncbi:hypothetical protein Tco_1394018 [Tanacetum coccineum]